MPFKILIGLILLNFSTGSLIITGPTNSSLPLKYSCKYENNDDYALDEPKGNYSMTFISAETNKSVNSDQIIIEKVTDDYDITCNYNELSNSTRVLVIKYKHEAIDHELNLKQVNVIEGSRKTFRCQVEDSKNLNLDWYWIFDGEPINLNETDKKYEHENDNLTTNLTILSVDKSSKGKYSCVFNISETGLNVVILKKVPFELRLMSKKFIYLTFLGISVQVAIMCLLIWLYERVYTKKNEYTFSHDLDTLKNTIRS